MVLSSPMPAPSGASTQLPRDDVPAIAFPAGAGAVAGTGTAGTFTSPQAVILGDAASGPMHAPRRGVSGATTPASASVSPLNTGSFGTGGRGAGGGGGFFFFGAAEMLAMAFLVALGAVAALGTTARRAAPPPFISLLERPG